MSFSIVTEEELQLLSENKGGSDINEFIHFFPLRDLSTDKKCLFLLLCISSISLYSYPSETSPKSLYLELNM